VGEVIINYNSINNREIVSTSESNDDSQYEIEFLLNRKLVPIKKSQIPSYYLNEILSQERNILAIKSLNNHNKRKRVPKNITLFIDFYLIRWGGYSSEWDSWEPEYNISKDMLKVYNDTHDKYGHLNEYGKSLYAQVELNQKKFSVLNELEKDQTMKPDYQKLTELATELQEKFIKLCHTTSTKKHNRRDN